MPKQQPSLTFNIALYMFGTLLLRGITFMLTPFILRVISPDQYGLLSLLHTNLISIIAPIMGLGLHQWLTIEYFHHETHKRKAIINDMLTTYLVIASPLVLILYCYPEPLYWCIGTAQVDKNLLTTALLIAFMYFFTDLLYQVMRYEQCIYLLVSIQLVIAGCIAIGTLCALYLFKGTIYAILCSQCIGTTLGCIIAAWIYVRAGYLQYVTIHIQNIVHYVRSSLPFIPTILLARIIAFGDRWFLVHMQSLHDVGLYAIADSFGILFQLLIIQTWSSTYLPHMLKQFTAPNADVLALEKCNKQYMYSTLTIGIGILVIGYNFSQPILRLFLPSAYHAAIGYIWLILLGQLFSLASHFTLLFIQYKKKRFFLSCGLVIPASINLLLNYLLIPRAGLYGCTIATTIAYLCYLIVTLTYNHFLQNQHKKSNTKNSYFFTKDNRTTSLHTLYKKHITPHIHAHK